MSTSMFCRVCVSEQSELVNMINLYYGSTPATTFIMDILQIKIDSEGSSALVMCSSCNTTLNNFYSFYNMVRDAQHKYNQIKVNSKTTTTRNPLTIETQVYFEDEDDLPLSSCVKKFGLHDNNSFSNESYKNDSSLCKSVEKNINNNVSTLATPNKCSKGKHTHNKTKSKSDNTLSKAIRKRLNTKQKNITLKTNESDTTEMSEKKSDNSNLEYNDSTFSRLRFLLTTEDNSKCKDTPVEYKDSKNDCTDQIMKNKYKNLTNWDDIVANSNSSVDKDVEYGPKVELRGVKATKTILGKYKLNEIAKDGKFLLNEEQMNEMFSLFYQMKCEFCADGKVFNNFDELTRHSVSVHSLPSTVECCGVFASVQDVMEDHILHKHLMPLRKKVACKVCNKLIDRNNHRVHLSTHLPPEKRRYQCSQCNAGFYLACYLRSHMERAHPKQIFTCGQCERTYKNKYSLRLHTKYAHSDNPLLCPECGKTLLCPSNYAAHMQKHNGTQDRVKCGKCDSVVLKVSLSAHMRIHKSIKKQCPFCPYMTVHGLREHIKRVHEKINRFSCAVCPMKFFTDTALKNHTASRHTGIPEYSCEFCGKTFMSSGNYHSHRTKMHPKQVAEKQLEKARSIDTRDIPVSDPTEIKRCNFIDERAEKLINVLEKSKHRHYAVDSLPSV